MKFLGSLGLALGLAFTSFSAQAAAVGAIWDTPTSGTLDGIGFTVSGFASPGISNANLSGPDFSAAPLSITQQIATYRGFSQFTVTFESAITDLLFYVGGWRGRFTQVPIATYGFSQDFEALSGLGDASVDSDTIAVSSDVFLSRASCASPRPFRPFRSAPMPLVVVFKP